MEYYQQPKIWINMLFAFDVIFVIIFGVEALIKICGYRFKRYIIDRWNQFDFFVVCVLLLLLFK